MPPTPPNIPDTAVSALQQGNKIQAIIAIRKADEEIGLKEAKDLVESYISSQPELRLKFAASQAETKRGCLLVLGFLAVLIAVGLIFAFLKA